MGDTARLDEIANDPDATATDQVAVEVLRTSLANHEHDREELMTRGQSYLRKRKRGGKAKAKGRAPADE